MKHTFFFTHLCMGALLFLSLQVTAQQNNDKIAAFLQEQAAKQGWKAADIKDWVVTNEYTSKKSGVAHVYIRQRYLGIEVYNGVANFNISKDGKILNMGDRLEKNIAARANSSTPELTPIQAIEKAAEQLHISKQGTIKLVEAINPTQFVYENSAISKEKIPIRLMWQPVGERLHLAWDMSIRMVNGSDWWSLRIDAKTGNLLHKNNWTTKCSFHPNSFSHCKHEHITTQPNFLFENTPDETELTLNQYRVFAIPTESPNHGARTLVTNPANIDASPFGWHDTNGASGAEYNITRGNNVYAYEDTSAIDAPGYSPNGGSSLNFDFTQNLNNAPTTNLNPNLTNLFYMNNIMHDIWYQYGFDEVSGNFQQTNYSGAGLGNDYVFAEGFDGGGTDNANFATPDDGQNPTMQMYLWSPAGGVGQYLDCNLDNGVVAHEYGHGISNRLTGGPANSGCLYNAEQMGEGWSDWFALMLTMKATDVRTDARGMATYSYGQATTGGGIREAPYSTDMNVNNYIYSDIAGNVTVPHGVGFVWATMLWEMTWDLIDVHGFNPDFYAGTGGNNIAMNLVIEGLKLQPCSPGFVDGRDAILLADEQLYGGAHKCLIWAAFARRGCGANAVQGSSDALGDEVAAFNIHNICLTAIVAPTAAFSTNLTNSCAGLVSFQDTSTNIPQHWLWEFGDGATSAAINPQHTYSNSGTYVVTLTVSNTIGTDVAYTTITVQTTPTPIAPADTSLCIAGQTIQLTASNTFNTVRWYNEFNTLVYQGNPYITSPLYYSASFLAKNALVAPSQNVGLADNSVGAGSYSTPSYAALNFTAAQPLEIVSAYFYSNYPTDTVYWFYLSHGFDGLGNPVQYVSATIPSGGNRVTLNISVPTAGNYSLLPYDYDPMLYSNHSGVNYPYTIPNLISLVGSPSGLNDYYYFYDMEVREAACESLADTVNITVSAVDFGFTSTEADAYFYDNSWSATSWFWEFGDGGTSTQQNPAHTYAHSGTYQVTLTIDGGCSISYPVDIIISSVQETNANPFTVKLIPNPTLTGVTDIVLSEILQEELSIQVFSTDGKLCKSLIMPTGTQQYTLPLQEFAPAVYWVRMRNGKLNTTQKLVIQK